MLQIPLGGKKTRVENPRQGADGAVQVQTGV